MDRRRFLQLGVAGGAALVSGCSPLVRRVAGRPIPENLAAPRDADTIRLALNRAGFGPWPGDLALVRQQGLDAWLEEQLHPTDDDDLALRVQLSRLDVNRLSSAELREIPEQRVMQELRASALLRAVYSKWTVRERLVDFWTNHFNIFARKGDGAYRKGVDDLLVTRKHALGSFPEMVRASARSAAMLGYLDNVSNKKGVPNENYARELMELHTLGVHGGYTQDDVREVARCFTGWTIETRFLRPKDKFRFDPSQHDDGSKLVLGHRLASGSGQHDGDRVLDILTRHPSCARFIATKLCRHFLGSAPESAVGAVAGAYEQSGGNIAAMMREVFRQPEFDSGSAIMKRPVDFLVSSLRSLGAETDAGPAIQQHLSNMGQPLFEWPMPDGYPDRTESWTGSLLARWNYATDLAHGKIPGTRVEERALRAADDLVGSASTRIADPRDHLALCLARPEFQWR